MNPDSHRDPKERILHLLGDHLQANPLRRMGPQRAGLRPCAVKPHTHPAHPSDEPCPYCPAPAVVAAKTEGQRAFEFYLPNQSWDEQDADIRFQWETHAADAGWKPWDEKAAP